MMQVNQIEVNGTIVCHYGNPFIDITRDLLITTMAGYPGGRASIVGHQAVNLATVKWGHTLTIRDITLTLLYHENKNGEYALVNSYLVLFSARSDGSAIHVEDAIIQPFIKWCGSHFWA